MNDDPSPTITDPTAATFDERSSSAARPSSALHARRATYDLLARLYLAEPDSALLDVIRDLPSLGELVREAPLEELQAEYQRLFGRNVYPYESIYVDHELMLNTAAADRIVCLYHACGFVADVSRVGAPDHLGLELRLMAHLLAIEAAAEARDDTATAGRARLRRARGLHEHLVRWAPACAQSVARVAAQPLYRAVAELTTELVLADLAVLPAPPLDIPLEAASSPAETSSEDERGIGQIVRQLLTPCQAGLFLSRADIGTLGRSLRLPLAIGDRVQMLRGLFDSAGQYEQLSVLLESLDRMVRAADTAYAGLMAGCPAWTVYGATWRQRTVQTHTLLCEMRGQIVGTD